MKTQIAPFFIALMLLASCSKDNHHYSVSESRQTESKGNASQKVYQFSFDEIEVSNSIHAEIYKSDEEKVVIEAPSDLMDKVEVENSGNAVHISVKSDVFNVSTKNIRAKIYVKDFSKLTANSSAEINFKDKFLLEKLKMEVSSSASVKGNLEANDFYINSSSSGDFKGNIWAVNLEVEASSSGDVSLNGNAKTAKFSSDSSGEIDGEHFTAESADLSASSSGNISIAVSGKANAKADSSGEITIYKKGNPTINSSNDSGGDVFVK